jgi:QWRF family
MEFSPRTTPEKKMKKQQEEQTSSRSIRAPSRYSVSSSPDHTSSPFSPYLTGSLPKTASSPLKGSSYASPRRSFCTDTSCRKPSPKRGVSAWALSPGRSMDMTVTRRKSIDCGRVGGGMGSVMGLFARRKKVDPAEEETVHQLRIILAQLVQWRYVNARVGAAMDRQRFVSEVGWMNLLKFSYILECHALTDHLVSCGMASGRGIFFFQLN